MVRLTDQKRCVGCDGKPVLQGLDFKAIANDGTCASPRFYSRSQMRRPHYSRRRYCIPRHMGGGA